MAMDVNDLGSIGGLGALTLVVGHMVAAYRAKLTAANTADERATPILAEMLKTALNDLSQSRTTEALQAGQIGDISARLETLEERYKERDEECTEAVGALSERVKSLESHIRANKLTPPETPAVMRDPQTGGYRVKNPG